LANLDIWRDEPVLDRIAALVERQAEGLAMLTPIRGIKNPRQCGTMIAVDLDVGDAGYLADVGPRLKGFFTERGLLLRPLGNTVYVMPPYCISADDLAAVHGAIDAAAAEFG
jgi:adenosylmethionine-8-amino-7-oxononanoate aminotransferase